LALIFVIAIALRHVNGEHFHLMFGVMA